MPSRLKALALAFLVLLLLVAPLAMVAQLAQFGSNASFGTVSISQTSPSITLTATFSNGGTIGSVAALTQGALNLDFAVTTAGTCHANQSYAAGSSCTVVATFTPLFAGLRYGAIVLEDNSGNTVATGYLQGVGSGPQAGFQPQQFTVRSFPYIGVLPVRALAVDGSGNVFLGSSVNGQYGTVMDEVPAGCAESACVKTLAGAYGAPWGVAVDGAGNVFVADVGASGQISEILASGGYSTVKVLRGNFGTPYSLAVDGSGNIFLGDGAVKEMPAANGYSTVTTVATGFTSPTGIAVDASGNLFVADQSNFHAGIFEILAVNGTIPPSPTVNSLGSGFGNPIAVAVDASGDVFATDSHTNHSGLFEILATGGYQTVQPVFTGFTAPAGLAMDASGNFYVVDNSGYGDYLNLVPRSIAPGLAFSTPTPPGVLDTADGPLSAILTNLGNMPLNLSGLALSNTNFTLDAGSNTCTTTSVLAPGGTCTAGVDFVPQSSDATLTGTLTFTDNSQNLTGSTQQASLSGIGLITPAVIVTPGSPNIAITQPLSVTIAVTGGNGKPTATGTVMLVGGGYQGTATPLAAGSATINIPAGALVTGTDTLAAQYVPDTASSNTYFLATGQGSVTVTTTAMVTPTVAVTPSFPATSISQALTVTATVSGGSGNPTPTGTVTFTSGIYTSPAVILSNGSATIVVPAGSLPLGANQFDVVYAPDAASSTLYLGHELDSWVTVTAPPPPFSPPPPGFGSLPIGQTSAVSTVTLTFGASATIGSVIAMTQGAPGLDFAVAPGGTCTVGTSFASGQTCTVNATFTPRFAGQRNGGIVVQDVQGKTLAQAYVHGTGTGPQLIFMQEPYAGYGGYLINQNSSSTTLGTGFQHPNVAVNGAGDVFVADWGNNQIVKIPAGCTTSSCAVVVMTGIYSPSDVAVDGAGNLFVTEPGSGDVKEIPVGCQSLSCVATVVSGLNQPYGVSLDTSGNIFVADTSNGQIKEALAASGYTTINILQTGLDLPWSVVTDPTGNLFVAEGGDVCPVAYVPGLCLTINTSLIEIPAASGYTTVNTLAGGIFGKPFGLAIDGSGNVYDGDFGNGCPHEFFAGSGYTSTTILCATAGIVDPEGIAVQGNGDIYLPDVIYGTVIKMDLVDQFPITFRTPAQVGQLDTVDGLQYFGVQNNGNAPLTFTAITLSDPSFQFSPTGTTCSTSTPLAPAASCLVAVSFQPITTGLHNATVTLTDNNLNQASTTQVFPLSADAIAPAPVILTNPANPTAVTSATFTFSDTQPNVTFVCSIDALPFGACATGVVYPGLPGGPHSFQVKAVDTLGHPSLAAVYNWTVTSAVTVTAPTITSGPARTTNSATVAFTFTDTQAGVSFLCSLDGVAFTACTSGISYTTTTTNTALNSYHTFAVEAQDPMGNLSQPASYPWMVTIDGIIAYPVDLGTVPVGQTSAPQTVTFNFTSLNLPPDAGPVASMVATTLGVTGQDFAVSNPGTCAVGTAITRTTVCTLQVTFSPKSAGRRKGGVVLLDATGNGIADAYLEGIGTAPQITFMPYTTVDFNVLPPQNNANPGTNLTTSVSDSTVDGAGNVYLTDLLISSVDGTISQSVGDIWKFPSGCTAAACNVHVATNGNSSTTNAALLLPNGLAMDGEGTLWGGNYELDPFEFPTAYGSPTAFTNWCEFGNAVGARIQLQAAVDGVGAVSFVGSGILSLCQQELGNVGPPIIIFQGGGGGGNAGSFDFSTSANSLAVDPQGNIFVADTGNNAVKEVLASSNYAISRIVGSGFNSPVSVASDSFGNIFVSDAGNGAVKEMTAASGYTTILTIAPFNFGTQVSGNNLSVDALGNVYVPNQVSGPLGQLVKLDFSDAPALNFPTPTKVATTDTTDSTLTATVKNSGNAPLTIASLTLSGNSFQIDANATTCTASTTVAVGSTCTIGVFFAPTATSAVTGTLTLTDNALNATAATQVFALSGTGYITPVNKNPTVVVTPGASTITTAQTLSVAVTVSGPTGSPVPTGSVSLTSGTYASATATLSGGTAQLTIPAGVLASGSHTLIAIYAPDQASSATYNDGAGTAAVTVTAATRTTPAVTVAPSPTLVTIAQDLTVTVTVAGGSGNPTPTGSVTLGRGAYSSGAVALVNGAASISIPPRTLPAGADTLTANYAPDPNSTANYNNATGSSSVTVQPVAKTTPTVTVSPSPTSINATQTVSVAIALNGGLGNPAPTGTVTLTTGTYSSGPLSESNGSITVTIPAGTLANGTDTLTANYTPDSTSASTFVTASGTGSVAVTVTTPAPVINSGPANPTTATTAAFTFSDSQSGDTFLCSLDNAAYTACVSGVSYSSLALGAHTFAVEATAGAGNISPAALYSWTINPATTQVTVGTTPAGLSFSVDGASYTSAQTLSWTVGSSHTIATSSPQTSAGTQNTFSSWSDAGAISHSVAASASTTSYTATFTTSYQLTTAASPANGGTAQPASGAFYASGTVVNLTATPSSGYTFSNWSGSVASAGSAATTVTMSAPETVTANFTLVPVPIAVLTPGPFTFTAITGATSAAQTATLQNTGNAPLTISSISITGANSSDFAVIAGSTTCGAALAAGSSCSISVIFTPAATASYTATLSVADNAAGSPHSAILNGTGTVAPSFTVSSPTGAQTVSPGGKATYTIAITPQNGTFANPVTLSANGLPAGATASFAPATLTPGSVVANSTLTIQTAAAMASVRGPRWPVTSAVLGGLVFFFVPVKRRGRRIFLMALLLMSLGTVVSLTGCGGGFALPISNPTNFNITVTATSGAVQQTTTVQLTVQ